ncbi:MAG: hypothetical protein QXX55_00180 [Candidatus Pacearchaeota archaeon]
MNFIKEIFDNKSNEKIHKQFIRFGRGEYGKKALLSLWKTKNVKISSSFEFANDFVLFVANLGNVKFHGYIWSKEEIEDFSGVKKEGKWIYQVNDLSPNDIKNLAPRIYYFLLNAEGDGIKLKIKNKLPKPGKGEMKVDDKFCQLELEERYYKQVKDDFFWDIPDCKKAQIEHIFIITDIILPKGETDYAKMRELAKRRGKVIRIAKFDGKETKKEVNFEA